MSDKRETMQQTLLVAFLLCLVCSILVAGVSVGLKDKQRFNRALDTQRSIVNIAGLEKPNMQAEEIQAMFENRISARLVDLQKGEFSDAFDAKTFDNVKAAKDSELSRALTSKEDIAKIRRIENYATVYIVQDENGKLESLIVPIRGYGLWGTLYGFLALADDLNTVVGMGFYDHKETPGLGGEVDNPKWRGLWAGKKIYAEQGTDVKLSVGDNAAEEHHIDGLAGATLTSKGVNSLIHFWLGERGFGPFIAKLRERGI